MKCKDCRWEPEKEKICFAWRAKGNTGCVSNGPPKPSLIRLLKSIWRAIIDHAGTCKDEYGTRKGE